MSAYFIIGVLSEIGVDRPVSRATAKRLLERIGNFNNIVLDFVGVLDAGQAFTDEIFRVFANAHTEVELVWINAVPEVQQMIRRAKSLRDQQAGELPR